MATNFIQEGKRLDYVASADIESGDVVVLGTRCAIATVDIDNGDTGTVALEGVWEVACKSSDVIAKYDALYWDATEEELTKTATANTYFGMAVSAAGNTVVTVNAKICAPAQTSPGAAFYVVAAGEFTTVGGDTAEAITVTGALATDLAVVTLHTAGSSATTIVTASAAADVVNVVFAGDPSDDHVVTYLVLRAV